MHGHMNIKMSQYYFNVVHTVQYYINTFYKTNNVHLQILIHTINPLLDVLAVNCHHQKAPSVIET